MPPRDDGLTAVPGVRVGHWSDPDAATGCTAILLEDGAVAGVAVRGPYPASRDLAFLAPTATAVDVHAVLLTGGSVFGMDAVGGVIRYLEERGRGARVGAFVTPRVPAVGIFDLDLGRSDVRPDAESGYAACEAATDTHVPTGTVGAGTGAQVGKLLGARRAMKGGFGTASVDLGDGVAVAAGAVTNAIGSVHDPGSGAVIAGPLTDDGVVDSLQATLADGYRSPRWMRGANTTLAVVATNATLTGVEATRLAEQAHDGLAMAVRPLHTEYDGDAVVCVSTRPPAGEVDPVRLGSAAVSAVARAVVDSVRRAESIHGVPAVRDLDARREAA